MSGAERGAASDLLQRFLDLPADERLLEAWAELASSPESAFQSLYKSILDHTWIDLDVALRAVDHLESALGSTLSAWERARLLRLRAHCIKTGGRAVDSLPIYERAWAAFEALNDHVEVAKTGIGWVDALSMLGEVEDAKRVTRKARRHVPAEAELLRARLEVNLTNAYSGAGRYQVALRRYESALETMRRLGRLDNAALVATNLANNHLRLGNVHRAREFYLEAQTQFREMGARIFELKVTASLATIELAMGNWAEALERLERIGNELEVAGDYRGALTMLQKRAFHLASIGAAELAEPFAARAFAENRRLGLVPGWIYAASYHARILADLGRHHDAALRFGQARDGWSKRGDLRSAKIVELEMARAQLDRGQAGACVEQLRGSAPYLRRKLPYGAGAVADAVASRAWLELGRPRLAVRLARRARTNARDPYARPERAAMGLLVARGLSASGAHGDAMRWVRRAVGELEDDHRRMGSKSLRVATASSRDRLRRQAVEVALESGGEQADRVALDVSVRLRLSGFVEDLLRGRDDPLRDELRSAITRLRDEYLEAGEGPEAEAKRRRVNDEISHLDSRLERLGRKSDSLARRVREQSRYNRWVRDLNGRQLVLFEEWDGEWSAFVVSPRRKVRRVELPGVEDVLRRSWVPMRLLFEAAARSPRESRTSLLDRSLEESLQALESLAEIVWRPLELDDGDTLVVPSGALHGLPLEAFATNGRSQTHHGSISRIPHPAVLGMLSPSRGDSALLLQGDSAGVKQEVGEVRARLREAGYRVSTGRGRKALRGGTGRLSALHVAAHGTYHRRNWLLSGIQLKDGWLGFEQLRPERIEGALLYLSSCESGMARELPGAEMDGWLAAGIAAGAAEMVLSLWKVDDEAATHYARHFYTLWGRGVPAAAAAQAARLQSRHELPHPYHWAPFIAMS